MVRPFFPDRPVDEARSLHDLQQGGLPLRAQRRIYEHHAVGRPVFTSTLSPAETFVARATALEAVSQVMGSSVFHVGFRGYASWGGGELAPLTAAYDQARSRALSRMQQEAALLRAHAVIGVKFVGKGYDWGEDLIEFNAIGTAVRIAGHAEAGPPVLTLMEADELWKLHQAGYWPVAIAMGNCFWYARHADCVSEGSFFSSELPVHSQAAQAARDLAVQRFRHFAHHFRADGVVGVRVHRESRDHEWRASENGPEHTAFSIELMLAGTAVVRRGDARPPARPLLVMDLRGRPAAQSAGGEDEIAEIERQLEE
jgi:uncharacterized protein YbjQ (UPF0145 family)